VHTFKVQRKNKFNYKISGIKLLSPSLIMLIIYFAFEYFDLDDYLTIPSTSILITLAIEAISKYGIWGIFSLMTLESASLPIPSEVVLPLSGFLASQGKIDLWMAFLASLAGSMIGSLIDYYIGYNIGVSALRHIRWMNAKGLDASISWFEKYGNFAVFATRFIAGARTLVSFPAGALKMRMKNFIILTLVGSAIWDASLLYGGFLLGSNWPQISSWFSKYFLPASAIIILVVILSFLCLNRRAFKKPSRTEDSA